MKSLSEHLNSALFEMGKIKPEETGLLIPLYADETPDNTSHAPRLKFKPKVNGGSNNSRTWPSIILTDPPTVVKGHKHELDSKVLNDTLDFIKRNLTGLIELRKGKIKRRDLVKSEGFKKLDDIKKKETSNSNSNGNELEITRSDTGTTYTKTQPEEYDV